MRAAPAAAAPLPRRRATPKASPVYDVYIAGLVIYARGSRRTLAVVDVRARVFADFDVYDRSEVCF